MKQIIVFIIGLLSIILATIFLYIDSITLPKYDIYNREEVEITYFDISREVYNDYPWCKDRTVSAWTKTEDEAFISVDIKASFSTMKKFDKTRESEVKGYVFDLARAIPNPLGRSLLITISNEEKNNEETIIYIAHLDWDKEYNMPDWPDIERKIKYDKPLG